MAQRTDVIGWEVERRGRVALVREDGRVEADDPEFAAYLRRRMGDPVTVFRRGTLKRPSSDPNDALILRPGDSRHIVACVRSLAGDPDGVQIRRIVWDQ